jgi:hypothetical protein
MNRAKLLPSTARLRANTLLDMLYSPTDLAEELDINVRAVYETLIPAGLPYNKDAAGHLWLHGPEVAHWVLTLKSKRLEMRGNEVYCLKCRKVVPLVKPRRVTEGQLTILKATCPHCGAKVNKGIKTHD